MISLPIVKLARTRRHCAECYRRAYWVFYDERRTHGFRVCWLHMSPEERIVVELASQA
jgi:hypothetical protein